MGTLASDVEGDETLVVPTVEACFLDLDLASHFDSSSSAGSELPVAPELVLALAY